jgi:flagellar basal-body rod protein FlgG
MVRIMHGRATRLAILAFLFASTLAIAQPTSPPAVPNDDIEGSARTNARERERRRAEIAALIAQATTAPTAAERGDAAFAAAGVATDGAARTLDAIQMAMETVAFNLRHADTTGFKIARVRVPGDGSMPKKSIDSEQGALENTGRNLDVGISGNGWFCVKIGDDPTRLGYTRDGNFFINKDGEVIVGLGDGYKLQPPIVIPMGATDISVASDGTVQYVAAGAAAKSVLGHIPVVMFPAEDQLVFQEPGVYSAPEAAGAPVWCVPSENGAGTLLGGFLEASNVDLTRERLRLRFLADWREAIAESLGANPKATTQR